MVLNLIYSLYMKLSLQRLERLNLKKELYLRTKNFEKSKMVFVIDYGKSLRVFTDTLEQIISKIQCDFPSFKEM
jgi:hypothetical protein